MSSRLAARITGTELGVRPRNYGHLQGLAARYARARLDGRAVVNRATQQPILLDWRRGLSEATAPGSAPELLLSLPALPSLLANARYLGSGEDPRRRPDVQQLHSFGATVDVTGRPIELRLIAREDRHGRLYVDGIVPCSPLVAPRADGGTLPDSAGARSCALRAVLDRATFSARREGGGATPSMDASSFAPEESHTPAISAQRPSSAFSPSVDAAANSGDSSADWACTAAGDACQTDATSSKNAAACWDAEKICNWMAAKIPPYHTIDAVLFPNGWIVFPPESMPRIIPGRPPKEAPDGQP